MSAFLHALRKYRIGILALLSLAVLLSLIHPGRWLIRNRQYRQLSTELRDSIREASRRKPEGISDDQWNSAVEWTANVVGQVFFSYDEHELPGLVQLHREWHERSRDGIDLSTLRWVWDQAEQSDSSDETCALRFRDVRLLVREPITDESLASLWSIDRSPLVDLSRTPISDASIPFLSELRHARWLNVGETEITDEGLEKLRAALPDCEVGRYPSGIWYPLFP